MGGCSGDMGGVVVIWEGELSVHFNTHHSWPSKVHSNHD